MGVYAGYVSSVSKCLMSGQGGTPHHAVGLSLDGWVGGYALQQGLEQLYNNIEGVNGLV